MESPGQSSKREGIGTPETKEGLDSVLKILKEVCLLVQITFERTVTCSKVQFLLISSIILCSFSAI